METSENRRYLDFDDFRVDVEERLLLRLDKPVPIAPKDFDLLMVLIENRGRLVTKEDLMDSVWQDTHVYEGNLNRHISTLRKLLGESHRDSRLITTIPKRGYRFNGEIREVFVERDQQSAQTQTQYRLAFNEVIQTANTSRWTFSLNTVAAAILASCLVLIGVVWVMFDLPRQAQRHHLHQIV